MIWLSSTLRDQPCCTAAAEPDSDPGLKCLTDSWLLGNVRFYLPSNQEVS